MFDSMLRLVRNLMPAKRPQVIQQESVFSAIDNASKTTSRAFDELEAKYAEQSHLDLKPIALPKPKPKKTASAKLRKSNNATAGQENKTTKGN